MAELVDAPASKAGSFGSVGSSPFSATKNFVILHLWNLDTKLSIMFLILESVKI
jgi:hypothetical protein